MIYYINESFLNEIDFEKEFSDVKKTCLSIDALSEYLNNLIKNRDVPYGKRKKRKLNMPFIHNKSRIIGDKLDIDEFKKRITEKPKSLISSNEKMKKSNDNDNYSVSTSFPALRGLTYDKDKDEFLVINTCPGAGECATICYALKGNYIRYPNTYDAYTKRLNYLLNHPDEYKQQLFNELFKVAKEINAFKDSFMTLNIRWNDSGDFFSKKYVQIAEEVLQMLDDENVQYRSYGYTKTSQGIDMGNTKMNYSMGGSPKELKKVKNKIKSSSIIIPKELHKNLDLTKKGDTEIYKQRVKEFFNIDNIITYREMLKIPESDTPKLNVIVDTNSGDNAARRKDVLNVYLTEH